MRTGRAPFSPLAGRDPRQAGPYVLLGRLGSGAMGRVFLGRSPGGRLVAVKMIHPEFAEEADFRARFAQEVAAAAQVSGAFTAPVISASPDGEVPWLATTYVAAPSLSRLVAETGPLPPDAVRWLAAGCAEALESVHSVGLIHRDLKPSNVLVSLDGPRVIDFGVARALSRKALTTSRHAVGTPAYMAPEQARDTRNAAAAGDVFSLGSTLLFAATGHAPYDGASVTDILVKLATEPPDLGGLPAELVPLVEPCLRRDPAARPTPAELLRSLAGEDFSAVPLSGAALALVEEHRTAPAPAPQEHGTLESLVPVQQRTERGGRRRRWLAAAALVAAGAAVGGIAAGLLTGGQQRRPDPLRDGGPPPPVSGATDRPGGPAALVVNQPTGDTATVFVLHGRGFRPGDRVAVSLAGVRTSAVLPLVDGAGTFNYAVDQGHQFFTGPMPPGVYTAVVRSPAFGTTARAVFRVDPRPG